MVKTIEVKLDTKGFAFESGEISKELVYLEQLMKSFSKELSQYLGSTTDAVQLLITTINKLAGSMEAVASWDVSGVSSELEKISKTVDDILKKLKETNWSEIISIGLGVYDSFGPNSNTFGKLGSGGYVGKFESGKSKKGGTQSGEGGLIDGINAVVSIPFEGINAALRFVKGIEIAGLKPFGGRTRGPPLKIIAESVRQIGIASLCIFRQME